MKQANAIRRYIPHLLLLLVLLVEIAAGIALRSSDEEIERAAREGSPEERVKALFIRMNRGVPPPVTREELDRILAEEPPLVREWTMASNFSRFGHYYRLVAYTRSVSGTAHAGRCRFLLDHRVGVCRWIRLAELRAFLESADRE